MRKDWILISIIGLILVVGLGLIGYLKLSKKEISVNPSSQVAGEQTSSKNYFSDDAKVMYFYSPLCHWCQQEEAQVLPGLGQKGYKVKPMDVNANPAFGQQYNISGTPTFVALNGDRLVGYQETDVLQKFLDQHK